ncbi:SusC/RagA family TonB-linked outer membrane protein [Pedobacter sp. MC2016-24]|uniref:SusC/RagA family TonB-linked outer membrane protein n=1 Tax=Pedobacter sp. MC2016-24 TaxID=2780090 RepID=UPI00187F6378|nr:SusC/RagA family TonB-linked outer membrane protein [Pedobacter sp. MC2016-24]MBE9597850.1 SusC/RagA family TonB-linked outer membrane protein [Pedobacter sp. MC2016-24]
MKKLIILMALVLVANIGKSQYKLNGVIRSAEDKKLLSGAAIATAIKGTIIKTDKNGNFKIEYHSHPLMLEISHVGYTDKKVIINQAEPLPIQILLEEQAHELNEVIISTGYQQLPKERSTGSFTVIDNKSINQQTGAFILDRLEAVANSVIVDRNSSGSNGRLMIRGLSTIQGPKDPLIILDNFPYEGDPKNINPNDVESITILKDAAAASIWGTRAGNGVIVITSKKGKYNQGFTVDFNSNVSITGKPDLGYLNQMPSSDFIQVEKTLYEKGFYDSDINSPSKPALSPVIELLTQRATASPQLAQEIERQIEVLTKKDVRNDFTKYFYQRSFNQQYALNINGGNELTTWALSGSYDHNNSVLNDKFKRYSLKLQNTYRPLEALEFSTSIWFNASELASGRPGYGSIISRNSNLYPYAQFADENGNAVAIPKDWRLSFIETVGNGKLADWRYYPLTDYLNVQNRNSINDLVINTGISYRLPMGFNVDLKYQYERQNNSVNSLQGEDSYFARNLVNGYTQISPTGELTYKIPKGGLLDLTDNLMQSTGLRSQLSFNQDWNIHSLNIIAGAELRQVKNTSNYSRLYGYNSDLSTSGIVDYTTEYPNLISGVKSFISGRDGITEQLNRFVSLFANAAYTYKDKYTASLSARRDASNLFGVSTNDKWKPLWSAGLSWEISKEHFFENDLIPYLKFRATYGLTGNVDPSKSALTTIQYSGRLSSNTLTPYSTFSKYADPELKWENTSILNFGIDFKTNSGRISGSLDYYRKKGTDLFGNTPIDYTAGIGSFIIKNVAAMKASGWDLQINTSNLNGNFKWFSSLNLSIAKNEVTQYYLNSTNGNFYVNNSNNISGIEGKPIYSVYAYRWAGLDPANGQPRGYINDQISKDYNLITSSGTQIEDLKYFGSALPTLFGTLGNTFAYHNFSLTIQITYKASYYFRKESINYPNLYTDGQGHADFSKRWQLPGDEKNTNVPAFEYPFSSSMQALYTFSEPLVEKADHIRLQYLNLQYRLNGKNLGKLPIKSIDFYTNVSDLGLVWKANKSSLDPDYAQSNAIPSSKNWTLGIRAKF